MRARRPCYCPAAITEPYTVITGTYVHFVTDSSMIGAEVEPMSVCPQCGGKFEQRQYGRRAVWCSDACRVAAFRQRRAAEQAINAERNEQAEATSAPAATVVARPVALPVGIFDLPADYLPVYGHLRSETTTAAPSAAGRARSTKAKRGAI